MSGKQAFHFIYTFRE
uniref:Uncharacterized protein n=1 Tax=Anguilla anguilla TaxID=7936 RepID=A0A0E9PR99_ANGAN